MKVVDASPLEVALDLVANAYGFELALDDSTWTNAKSKAVNAVQGVNRMELRVKSGTILFDWVDIE